MKLHVEVEPNAYNESGCVIVIYRVFLFMKFEIGRVLSAKQLDLFIEHYKALHGKFFDTDTYGWSSVTGDKGEA